MERLVTVEPRYLRNGFHFLVELRIPENLVWPVQLRAFACECRQAIQENTRTSPGNEFMAVRGSPLASANLRQRASVTICRDVRSHAAPVDSGKRQKQLAFGPSLYEHEFIFMSTADVYRSASQYGLLPLSLFVCLASGCCIRTTGWEP